MRNRLLMLAVLVIAPSAHADRPKYVRKQHLEIDVKPSERVKPIEPAKPVSHQPAVTADQVLMIEERVDPIRQEQEAILLGLIRDTPDDDPDKPDYLFRLAEHYASQLRLWRLKAVEPTIHERIRP